MRLISNPLVVCFTSLLCPTSMYILQVFFSALVFICLHTSVNCSRLLNNTNVINGVFKKWNIHIPSDGSAEMSTGTRKEFSAVIAAILVLSIGIGVAGIIGIVIACRKKKRYAKRLTRSM